MSGFNNPIIGGSGKLVYPQIESPNFVDSVSGWQIAKDGSAEFNNLEVRGTFLGADYIINSAGAFFYSGTPAAGNLIVSIASTGGTDQFGNTYDAGITSYNPALFFANLFDGSLALGSLNPSSLVANAGGVAFEDATAAGAQPNVEIFSPTTTLGGGISGVWILGESNDTTKPSQVVVNQSTGVIPASSALLEVQGAFHASGIVTPGAGTNGSGSAPQLAPGLTVNTPSQLSDTTRDYMIYLTVGTAGTGVQVKIGPNNPPVRNVYGSATPTAGQQIVFRLPAGFWAEVTGTGTTIAAQNAIGC